jgi:hypothetical protein
MEIIIVICCLLSLIYVCLFFPILIHSFSDKLCSKKEKIFGVFVLIIIGIFLFGFSKYGISKCLEHNRSNQVITFHEFIKIDGTVYYKNREGILRVADMQYVDINSYQLRYRTYTSGWTGGLYFFGQSDVKDIVEKNNKVEKE